MSNTLYSNSGGIEGKLENAGFGVLIFFCIMFLIFLIRALDAFSISNDAGILLLVIAFALLALGVVFYILFQAFGETIKLLKKLNGLPYGGKISDATEVIEADSEVEGEYCLCTDCQTPVAPDAKFCPKCGVRFDE